MAVSAVPSSSAAPAAASEGLRSSSTDISVTTNFRPFPPCLGFVTALFRGFSYLYGPMMVSYFSLCLHIYRHKDKPLFLDAIRKAGGKEGAGLKSIKERKAEERKRRGEEEAAPPPSGGGGDLMGDLMSKLTMRRKGISGTKAGGGKDPEEQGGGDARVSWACTEVWWPVAGLGPWCPLAVHEPPPWLPLQCSFTTVDITANMVWIPTYPAGAGTGYSGLWGEAWSGPRGPAGSDWARGGDTRSMDTVVSQVISPQLINCLKTNTQMFHQVTNTNQGILAWKATILVPFFFTNSISIDI